MKPSRETKPAALPLIGHVNAHRRVGIACVLAIVAFFALHGHAVATQLVAAWDVFALVIIALSWFLMSLTDPYEVRRNARIQDASQTFLFIVVISAATISLFAVFILLGPAKTLEPKIFVVHIVLSIAAIVLSWTLVHTLFGLRYAHLYYIDAHERERKNVKGGLIFPDDDNPDYLDFAYFSFVVGMTCQVSDVQISAKRLRRLATVHGLISFAFNTAILALFVNIVAGLI